MLAATALTTDPSCSAKDWQSYSTRSCQPRVLEETDERKTIGPSRQRCSFAARNGQRPRSMGCGGAFVSVLQSCYKVRAMTESHHPRAASL